MYFDQFFTFQVELIAFFVMMLSFSIRAQLLSDINIETTKAEWGITHSTAGALEFVLYGIFCFYLSLSIRRVLLLIYEHKRKLQKVQDQLSFGFANIIEAKDENDMENFIQGRKMSFLSETIGELDDFELICFLVIR